MAAEVWKNPVDNRVYRVDPGHCEKVRIDHLDPYVEDFDLWLAGLSTPSSANTTGLRAWLASIPTVV